MKFKLKQQILTVQQNQFTFDNQVIELNDKTQNTLLLFLQSNNTIISKDELLERVWLGVIVSDASIFKQIQTLRHLLVQAGLPDDSIENIYGKGYRLKYPVSEYPENAEHKVQSTPEPEESSTEVKPAKPWFTITIIAVAIIAVLVYFLWQSPFQRTDKLNAEQKSDIVKLAKNNWQDGLEHIDNLLANPKNAYSTADLAYLYQQKGQAEKHLQQIDESLVSLTESLKYYTQVQDPAGMGQAHLLTSRLYDYIDNPEKQLQHIQQAITLFNTAEDHTAEIDAYLELAYLQKKSGAINESIKTYQQSITRAQQVKDPVGEMIAINNLAATYLIINDTDQALTLAEQGLALSLTSGNGQHIANSYSFLSQIAVQQGDITRALKMLEQALKYQLESNSHKNLSPKLMNLNFLLLETHQYDSLNELLQLTDDFATSLRIKNGAAIIDLYQGMHLAYQDQWSAALTELESAWQISTKKNFSYKKPLMMAFLGLAYAQNNNHLKAIEFANQTLKETQISPREINLAHLTLAISFTALENAKMSTKWTAAVEQSMQSQWPAEQQTWLEFKLAHWPQDDITTINSLQQQLAAVQQQKADLAANNAINVAIFAALKTQVLTLIEQHKVETREAT